MQSGPTKRRSFGYDLFSLIGPELVKGATILSAFSGKELPWAQATLACRICSETAARVALGLRTFSESTHRKISGTIGNANVELYDAIGALVHHNSIELFLDPPLLARPAPAEWIETSKQSRHKLTDLVVTSDKRELRFPLSDFADAVNDEIHHQINSPEGRIIKRESKWRS